MASPRCQELESWIEIRSELYKTKCLDVEQRDLENCETIRLASEQEDYRKECIALTTTDVYQEDSAHADIGEICNEAGCFKPSTEEYIADSHDCDDFALRVPRAVPGSRHGVLRRALPLRRWRPCHQRGPQGRHALFHRATGEVGHCEQLLCLVGATRAPSQDEIPASVGAAICTLLDPSTDGSRELQKITISDEGLVDSTDKATDFCAAAEAEKWWGATLASCNQCCNDVAATRQTHLLPAKDPLDPSANTWLRQCQASCQASGL